LDLGHFSLIVFSFFLVSLGLFSIPYLTFGEIPAYELTENDMEWCDEVFPLYEAIGLQWFLENHHYSIKARVCGSLFEDPIWEEAAGEDRLKKLQERSNYYVELEIKESEEEAEKGIDDPTPVGISQPESRLPTESAILNPDILNEEARIIDAEGKETKDVPKNQDIEISSEISNFGKQDQNFVFIVQIKNSDDIVVSLNWIKGTIFSGVTLEPSLKWTPDELGVYTTEIYLWDNLDDLQALNSPISTTFVVR